MKVQYYLIEFKSYENFISDKLINLIKDVTGYATLYFVIRCKEGLDLGDYFKDNLLIAGMITKPCYDLKLPLEAVFDLNKLLDTYEVDDSLVKNLFKNLCKVSSDVDICINGSEEELKCLAKL